MKNHDGERNLVCRFCQSILKHTFVDLGMSPLCENYLTSEQLNNMEEFYPLHVHVCENCFLVQLEEYVSPEAIFTEYAYFSSYADTWVQHAKNYTEMIAKQLNLQKDSLVIEIASNDGYLLQHFLCRGIPILGIEPAENVAKVALEKNIPTITKFFNRETALHLAGNNMRADLLIGNNVLAQVPNINSFVSGLKILLKPQGIITLEFPHLIRLVEDNQFDTIYHEHFSYFSFYSVEQIFTTHGLSIFDVEELPTHGGSLRIYARHLEYTSKRILPSVTEMRKREESLGITQVDYYASFGEQVKDTKRKLLRLLIRAKEEGKSIAGYGAPGKGNTLLNYCGIRMDFIDYTVDRNPYKQGKFLPGTHIPIYPPSKVKETKPDYLLVLPWNFKDEIVAQMVFISEWGGKFIIPIPEPKIFS